MNRNAIARTKKRHHYATATFFISIVGAYLTFHKLVNGHQDPGSKVSWDVVIYLQIYSIWFWMMVLSLLYDWRWANKDDKFVRLLVLCICVLPNLLWTTVVSAILGFSIVVGKNLTE